MPTDRGREVQDALQLIRAGRFLDAVTTLQGFRAHSKIDRITNLLATSILADALQRTGENEQARLIASHNLSLKASPEQVKARCNFVLGNVSRERGEITRAIEHFQVAAVQSEGSDIELCCWAHLRLMASVAELEGTSAAVAHLDNVRRILTRSGDPRPFAALHLWLAEMEGTRGNLKSARRHIGLAESLLSQVDDVWLRGYLAINNSGVSYYRAETTEARRWAELAVECARKSGHRSTRRAANSNLGEIELSAGHLLLAEGYFTAALQCCELGSADQIAVLDSLAQVKLHVGDLEACRSILGRIEELTPPHTPLKLQRYKIWTQQTNIQLLLKEGRTEEATRLSQCLAPAVEERPLSRTTTLSHLLAVEASIAHGDFNLAACRLSPIVSPQVQLPPDLYAMKERLVGKILGLCQATELGHVHMDRALRTFRTIGHSLGEAGLRTDVTQLAPSSLGSSHDLAPQHALFRLGALLDTRTQPELFAPEAVSFLRELGCAEDIALIRDNDSAQKHDERPASRAASAELADPVRIDIARTAGTKMLLSFVPRLEPLSLISALHFRRVIDQILSLDEPETALDDGDIVWAANDWSSTTGVVFAAESMFSILKVVKTIAPTDVSVLVTGETGSGKEVIARSIHEQSVRASMPFLAINCAAIPKDLLESQLFGYRRGAFSGATEAFQGVVRAANGGTLLLDEIGEIPMDMQVKLLRFLELGEVHALGEAQPYKANVRLVFATNQDLEAAVRERRFREDLFHRLNVVPIRIPPLRERREEIPLLARLFSQRFAREFSKKPVRFSDAAMELLVLHDWPGNVRQLGNEVRRLAALLDSSTLIVPDHLSKEVARPKTGDGSNVAGGGAQLPVGLNQTLSRATMYLEREMIKRALNAAGGRVATAAASLGLSRKGLYLKRRRLELLEGDRPI